MPPICPRPCSRLATAAVFISVGVVQVIVGIILLRSKYVYLLAGPDFWTAACNIAVGCLLGLSAGLWKLSKKRPSRKDVIRRNLLVALIFSALVINSTTLGIYLLGEGNALLSMRLENGKEYSLSSFASEVLAFAFVTSVCCPVVCIVVAIVAMSGSFFIRAAKKSLDMKTPYLEKERSRSLRWVYTPEEVDTSEKRFRDLILSSSSESSDEDDSRDVSVGEKYSYSADDILNRMAKGKRDNILNDSAMMVRQMDRLRRSRGDLFNRDGSYTGSTFPRAKKISETEERPTDFRQSEDMAPSGARKSSDQDPAVNNANYPNNKQFANIYKNRRVSVELLNEYQNAASKLAHHYPSMYKKFREILQRESAMNRQFPSGVHGNEIEDTADDHKKSMKLSEDEQNDTHAEPQRRNYKSSVRFKGNERCKRPDTSEETSPNDCFSPDEELYLGADSISDVSRDSWAGDIIPINLKHSTATKSSQKLVPVASPQVPDIPRPHHLRKFSEDSGIGNAESSSFIKAENNDFKEKRRKLSSFGEYFRARNQENAQEYPEIGTHSARKLDLNKTVTMESISEEPNREQNKTEAAVLESVTDFHGKGHLRNKSLSCIEPGPSRRMDYDGDIWTKNLSPRKKKGPFSRDLHKIWHQSVRPPNIRDMMVHEDFLTGFEEPITRQSEIKSIEKVGTPSMRNFDLNTTVAMGSISEDPNAEQNKAGAVSERVGDFSGRGTISEGWKGRWKNKSLSCIVPGPSRHTHYDGNTWTKNLSPRKKRNASIKSLQKIWSMGSLKSPPNVLDLVVDEDSLIGLSEEELIARQLRARSIRKEIAKRMKEEMSA